MSAVFLFVLFLPGGENGKIGDRGSATLWSAWAGSGSVWTLKYAIFYLSSTCQGVCCEVSYLTSCPVVCFDILLLPCFFLSLFPSSQLRLFLTWQSRSFLFNLWIISPALYSITLPLPNFLPAPNSCLSSHSLFYNLSLFIVLSVDHLSVWWQNS